MKYQLREDPKIWTDLYYFRGRETRARLQLVESVDGDEKLPWKRAPTGLESARKRSADREFGGRDDLLVRHSSSAISSSSFCDRPKYTTDPTSPSLSTQITDPALQRPIPSLAPVFFPDPESIGLHDSIDPSSPALDDPYIFDPFLDACIEKTRKLIAAAQEALRSSSPPDAGFGGENDEFHDHDDDDAGKGRSNDKQRTRRNATPPQEHYPPSPLPPISHSESRDDAVEARLNDDDDDGNGALGYLRGVGRGRAREALKKEIVTVEGWWKVKDGEAAWREIAGA